MALQCAARFTLTLDLPGKKKPFITFQCERLPHEDGEHFTTGLGNHGQTWKMSWHEPPVKRRETCSQL